MIKRSAKPKQIGKKGRAWINERNRQKKISLVSNQMYCQFQFEGCRGAENLGYSHPEKRRNTKDLSDCVLACSECHRRVENVKPQSEKIRLHDEARARSAEAYFTAA